MIQYEELVEAIESFAPIDEYREIDSSGTQIRVGDGRIDRILVCLEINDAVIDEAVRYDADMIITHHPLLFYPLSSVTIDDVPGRYVARLLEKGISVYSSHLPFDFCPTGNNAYLAERLNLVNVKKETPELFTGCFEQELTLEEACRLSEEVLDLPKGYIHVVDGGKPVRKVGMCTGAGGDLIRDALAAGCDLFITGDLKLHEAQYAKAMGISIIDGGHYGTEKSFTENFARQLRAKLGENTAVLEAKADTNPYTW
ncbi:MAG: Nif3-like dinuclear metal center hexameric protein [Firmicutes bacterium]|nr:Nif3-like dinuclear metal center hexameric protein [Bacillota bacterium]